MADGKDQRIRALGLAMLREHSARAALLVAQSARVDARSVCSSSERDQAAKLFVELRDSASAMSVLPQNAGKWADMLPADLMDRIIARALS